MNKCQSFEWNCTENQYFHRAHDQLYEQCTITVEYRSIQDESYVCRTHRLSIKTLPPLSFSSNHTMTTFKINSCQLLTLNQIPFVLPTSVEKLDFSYNLLSTFTLSFPLPSFIKYLHLDHNPNLIDINFGYHHVQQRLIGLSLRHNKNIKFSSLPMNLLELDLTDCNLLPSTLLLLLKPLTKLTHLSLASNQLRQLPVLNKRIQFEYLNLSNNYLISIDHPWLHKSLKVLDLKYNQIKSLEFFKELWKTTQMSMSHNDNQTMNYDILNVELHGNPLTCDCWLGSVLDSLSINITDLSLLQCHSQSIMHMSHNDFHCAYSQHCTPDCSCCDFEACDCHFICPQECLCFHDTLWSNHIIQCQQQNLTELHNHLPETVTELNYENNHIEDLKSLTFIGKNSLIKLNLARNHLKNLTKETFCSATNLYEVNLSHNPNLKDIVSNMNELFSCLQYLRYIVLSREQINNDEEISDGWIIDSSDDLIRLRRLQEPLSSVTPQTTNLNTHPVPTDVYSLIETETERTTLFSMYNHMNSSFIQHHQTLIVIIFFLLLFLLLFLIILISLAMCRRKIRRHLTAELQRQRSHAYYYHTSMHPTVSKTPNSSANTGPNESLYEQLPSLSSDSDQPFLYHEKKGTNVPTVPPFPPKFPRYHCCHSSNTPDYVLNKNSPSTCYSSLTLQQQQQQHQQQQQTYSCPAVLVLRNQLCFPNQHEYACNIHQYLLTNQQEQAAALYCCTNQQDIITPPPPLPPTVCQCNSHMQNIDTCIYPNVHK